MNPFAFEKLTFKRVNSCLTLFLKQKAHLIVETWIFFVTCLRYIPNEVTKIHKSNELLKTVTQESFPHVIQGGGDTHPWSKCLDKSNFKKQKRGSLQNRDNNHDSSLEHSNLTIKELIINK